MGFLAKMRTVLSGHPETSAGVRLMLEAAWQSRAKISLDVQSNGKSMVMVCTIEQVRESDLVISQPTLGGMTHQLAFGEPMKMSFVTGSTYHSGTTRCLGRVKIPSEADGSPIFAYSMAMPDSLETSDRRGPSRVNLGFQRGPEAQLYSPALTGPVLGTILDISMAGAQIRTHLPAGKIASGQDLFLKAILGEPVGLVDEMVSVSKIEPDAATGQQLITISFRRRIEGLDTLLRSA